MVDRNKEVASLLLSIKAVCLSPQSPFTYTSGLKGPIYCDNRKILSHVAIRDKIITHFVDLIKENDLHCDSYAGLATAGIPHAALIADRLKSPMIYIRSKAKEHGKQNQIEGDYKAGDKIILIEDLINQAGSLKTAHAGAIEAGLCPIACLAIVNYQMDSAQQIVKDLKLPLYTLTNLDSIVKVCAQKKQINSQESEMIFKWRENPSGWGQA